MDGGMLFLFNGSNFESQEDDHNKKSTGEEHGYPFSVMKSAQGYSTRPWPGYQDGIETPVFTRPTYAEACQEYVKKSGLMGIPLQCQKSHAIFVAWINIWL
jgi:hypothetical protein